ncbi:hypothetical protein N2605_27810 [Bradyrhizobium yuanmingense]|uniref:hypothetical protein n=1 Tax=Bradyrhizobium yuanmingense TaxID=108015 RepID=UPI0021A77764|nr:hypothetical protein [Bradyrhizobium sp. CB1024]UWU83299.1 hypothetical protein N2605_27810 [Bradyrhizobium sp. CB1024]
MDTGAASFANSVIRQREQVFDEPNADDVAGFRSLLDRPTTAPVSWLEGSIRLLAPILLARMQQRILSVSGDGYGSCLRG